MTESAVPRPKRRRRWLLALLPLALLGFGWWWSTRPPPLPKFLEPFADRTLFREQLRQDAYTTKSRPAAQEKRQLTALFIDATPESVMRSMLDQYGTERVRLMEGGVALMAQSESDPEFYIFGAFFQGRPGTEVLFGSQYEKIAAADQVVSQIWPGWLDVRFGQLYGHFKLEQVIKRDPAYRTSVLKDIINKHAAKTKAKK